MKSQTLLDFSKSLGCALMASPNRGKSEGGSRHYYYYHRLLRRSIQVSLRYITIASQFTQSEAKGRTLYRSVILFSMKTTEDENNL